MTDQIELFSDVVGRNGYRLTAARRAIIVGLVDCGGHITADDLAAQVRATAPKVGRMTVYRTLDLLCELGLIRPIFQGTGAAHYILLPEGSHHHLICNRCHQVIEFDSCQGGELAFALGQTFNFQVQSHLFEIHGLCEDCQS